MKKTHLALALLATTLGAASPAYAGSDWDWAVVPYVWAVSIDTDLSTDIPPSQAGNDTNFNGVLSKLDGFFEIHAEGQGDNFGLFTDFTYLGLADDKEFTRFDSDSDLDARLFELAAVWRPGGERGKGFDLFGGLRYIDLDLAVQLDPVDPAYQTVGVDVGDSFSDLMLGARYTWPVNDRIDVTVRGDGSFGDTDGTFNASVQMQYKMSNGAWVVGYRYLDGEFGSDNRHAQITLNGLQFGYAFKF